MSTPTDTTTTKEMLATGWQALARTEWDRARSVFEAAVRWDESAEALEGLSLAAWWLDDAETMFATRERVYRLYRRDGDLRSAGRLATLLGIDYFSFRGEAAIGNGWFVEAARSASSRTATPAAARRLGHEAAELGRALGDLDTWTGSSSSPGPSSGATRCSCVLGANNPTGWRRRSGVS